jgi:hypothetical protein
VSKENEKHNELSEAAKKLGSKGGKKGGPARARKLTAAQRKKIAEEGAKARWKKKG